MENKYYIFKDLIVFLKNDYEIEGRLVDIGFTYTMNELFIVLECNGKHKHILLSDVEDISSYETLNDEDIDRALENKEGISLLCIDCNYAFIDDGYVIIDDLKKIEFCDCYGEWRKIEDLYQLIYG